MNLNSDLFRAKFSLLIVKMWKDEKLEKEFIINPLVVLKAEGFEIPEGIEVKVYSNTKDVKYLPLTKEIDLSKEEEQKRLIALFSRHIPIPQGKEVRFVQSSDDEIALIIPPKPPKESIETLSQVQLTNLAASSGFEATYHDTTQTLEAETTELVVAETTEAMHAETSVAVVAEVALVLI